MSNISSRHLLIFLSVVAALFGTAVIMPIDKPDPAITPGGQASMLAPELVADIAITKTGVPDPVVAGEALVYTLMASNVDSVDATTVLITDTLPMSVTFAGASPNCTYLSGSHEVSCSLASLVMTSTTVMTVNVIVDPAAAGDLINRAFISHDNIDPNPGNNSTGPITTTVVTSADVGLSKAASDNLVAAGDLLTYTLTVTNTGPSMVAGVLLTDTLPTSGVAFASVTPGGCAHSTGIVNCDLGSLLPDQSVVVEIVVDVDTTATGGVVNTAVVNALTPDPNTGNNTASVTTQVESLADMSILTTDVPDPVTAGLSVLTYTLTIENLGPSVARSVSALDDLPEGVTFARVVSPPIGCSYSSGTVLCSLGDLDAGENGIIEIETTVNHNAPQTIENFANVTSLTTDPVSGNNLDGEQTQVTAISDLTLTGSEFPDPVSAGTRLTYTLSITNSGPSTAAQTVMTATLPADAAFDSASPQQGSCNEAAGIVTCELGNLAPAQSIGVGLVALVEPGYGGLLSATFETASNSMDPAPGDNLIVLETNSQAQADLLIEKQDMPEALPPGANLLYTIRTENLGPSDAAGVVMTDTLPAEVNFISLTPPEGGNCSGITTISCSLALLSSGQVATATILVEVDAAAPLGTITNTAEVDSATTDPNPANNLAVQTTTVSNEIIDLTLGMVESADPLLPGEVLTYTLFVTNTGPSVATNVVLTDTLPTDITLINAGASQGSCTMSGPVICSLGSLAWGASATVIIEGTVNSNSGDLLTNSAEVTGFEADSDISDNSATIQTTVFVITWIEPVSEGERYDAGVELVLLEVAVTDRLAIDRVEFRRWDTETLSWVMIGTVTATPYEMILDSTILNFKWNEIRARAFDIDGNVSAEPRIWVYRLYSKHFPLIVKN